MRLLALLALLACASSAQTYFPPPDSAGGWRATKNAADALRVAGMDLARLDQAFEYASRTSAHGGVLVARHGWLVYERYYGRGNREANPAMASVGKAYTSIACGIMLKEQRSRIPQGLDQKVFTPEYLPEAFPLSDPSKADIKLGHLLTMTSGMWDGGAAFTRGELVPLKPLKRDPASGQDESALRSPMWCKPGEGYSYSSQSTHVASMVLRHVTGMEMEDYIRKTIAEPMQWGRWTYARNTGAVTVPHTPGGGNIAVRATDALRFAYLLLHKGKWATRQLVPADYIDLCAHPSPYNPHTPYSLQFSVNQDGHVAAAPRDAFFKSGAGGFGIYVVPSLDLVIYKMAGDNNQYAAERTGLPLAYTPDASRDQWKPAPKSQFADGPVGTDDSVRRLLEMVVAAVVR
jgi:CubicO group peptidase (beta-lactamase class C family)